MGDYYNIFRWYRAGGRYTQSDPIGLQGQDTNLHRYVLNSTTFSLNKKFDHCYIESNKGGVRQTWGLYGQGKGEDFIGQPNKNDASDVETPTNNRKCGPWYRDCTGCLDLAMKNYPIEDYSVLEAPLGFGSGRNSNTFARCMLKKCLPEIKAPFHTAQAAGWDQPCPTSDTF